jgi:hypothetical protein
LSNWIAAPQITFDPICDRVADTLLTLVATEKAKHFTADRSGQCFRGLRAAVRATKAITVCAVEQKRRRHDGPRLQIALALRDLAGLYCNAAPAGGSYQG